jgi:putative transposase
MGALESSARVVIEQWRQHYNAVRPRSSLGDMTPAAYSRIAQTNINMEATLKN